MREIECVQGTDDWWQAKLGIPSASNFKKIMQPTRRKASSSQEKYIAELIGNITDPSAKYFTTQGGPVNGSVEYGRQTESEARRWYELNSGRQVREVGFCVTDDGRLGASPDGMVDPEGILEIKCPDRDTHALCLMKDEMPAQHLPQCHGQLIVTGRAWCDFVSYCTGLPALVKRVVPDDFTLALRVQLELFLDKYAETKKSLNVDQPKQIEQLSERDAATLEEYRQRLVPMPDVATVNGWLHELPGMVYALKREVWLGIKAYADGQGWEFNGNTLKFVSKESISAVTQADQKTQAES